MQKNVQFAAELSDAPSAYGAAPSFGLSAKSVAALLAKLAVAAGCFWYISRQINFSDFLRAANTLDVRWAIFAAVLSMIAVPLIGWRWSKIVHAIHDIELPHAPLIAITWIAGFFGQAMPSVGGEAVRVWLFTRLGQGWRLGLVSALIDRGIGVLVLLAIGIVTLLFPSALTALGSLRIPVIGVFSVAFSLPVLVIIFGNWVGPLLARWQVTRWLATVIEAAHRAILGSPASLSIIMLAVVAHSLVISAIWLLGRAQGLDLPVTDAAVLFTLMVGITLIPISISGWGVREFAVVALLQGHDIAPERALFFSVSFGLVVLASTLPGALVWALYWPKPLNAPTRA